MTPLSNDLRERILSAVQSGKYSLRELASIFSVGLSSIVRLLRRFRETGSIDPKPHAGGPSRVLDADAEVRLLELVRQFPDATLKELRDKLGVPCCLMTIFRALERNKITRKKKTVHAEERDSPRVRQAREEFKERMAEMDPNRFVFVDETGATTAMNRTHGRAPEGERVVGATPGRWENVTLISGLRTSGVVAPMAIAGAVDRNVFDSYVIKMLVPELRAGDIVLWDNVSAHLSAKAEAAIEAIGAQVVTLPVYSPDFTPIEEMFSKVKSTLRTIAARTVDTVINAMGTALNAVSRFDILGWFHDRCPYSTRV